MTRKLTITLVSMGAALVVLAAAIAMIAFSSVPAKAALAKICPENAECTLNDSGQSMDITVTVKGDDLSKAAGGLTDLIKLRDADAEQLPGLDKGQPVSATVAWQHGGTTDTLVKVKGLYGDKQSFTMEDLNWALIMSEGMSGTLSNLAQQWTR